MATCPKCHGHLTTGHQCQRGRYQDTIDLVVAGVVGGLTALLMVAIFDRAELLVDLDGYFLAGGIAIGMITQSLLRSK
jgi:hypothetical protein